MIDRDGSYHCSWCGDDLPEGFKGRPRHYCNADCVRDALADAWQNGHARLAIRLKSIYRRAGGPARAAVRPPCRACGAPTEPARFNRHAYCSLECIDLAIAKAKARRDRVHANTLRCSRKNYRRRAGLPPLRVAWASSKAEASQ